MDLPLTPVTTTAHHGGYMNHEGRWVHGGYLPPCDTGVALNLLRHHEDTMPACCADESRLYAYMRGRIDDVLGTRMAAYPSVYSE